MARPRKCRRVCGMPRNNSFAPMGSQTGEERIIMAVDEYETIRLIDLAGYTQEECAAQMGIARTTVQGIYNDARRKLADTLVNGKTLVIEGGDIDLCQREDAGCGRKCGQIVMTILGSTVFAMVFALFLMPNDMNAGGISGLAQVVVEVLGFGSVGSLSILINMPLFILGGIKIGRRFFVGSLMGMVLSSILIDVFALYAIANLEPLICVLYGGVICGLGLGIVFISGTSTGGSDILVRLLKLRYRNVPIGQISLYFDVIVVALTGIVFQDVSKALYTGIAVFVTSQVIDAVVYRFDYSKVALIISKEYEAIAEAVGKKLYRGATFLHGEGSYSHTPTKVVLTAVKKQQVAELKELVTRIDPNAFIIVQEAHQVLGDGFSRYSKESL